MRKIIFFTLVMCISLTQSFAQVSPEKQETIKALLKKYTAEGIPGIGMSISNKDGIWSHAEGMSNIENNTPLTTSHLHYLQSISKTYTAGAILKLYEQGKLKLEDKAAIYLKGTSAEKLSGIENVTIKMLLNHTSGLAEYSTDPRFVSAVLTNPLHLLNQKEILEHIIGEKMQFPAGSRYRYTNTNYLLLCMILDKVTGDHMKFIEDEVLKPAGLSNTHFLTKKNYSKLPNMVDSYWDVLNVGKPANVTQIQKVNVASLHGDDGMVCTTEDAVKFMAALANGKILKPETFAMMQQWVNNDSGKPAYGLGLSRYDLGVTYGIGHSGGGLGAGCVIIYIPEVETYIFLAANINTMIESPIAERAGNLQMELLGVLFQ